MHAFLKTLFVLCLAISFLGCSGAQKSTVPQKMVADLNDEIAKCQAERKALAREVISLNEQLDTLKKEKSETKRLESENLALTLRVKELSEQLDIKKKDAAIASLERKLGAANPPKVTAKRNPGESVQSSAKTKTRIKVLSGNGQTSSVKRISASLSSMGYKVAKVGKADRADFKRTTVYYSPDAKSDAMDIARRLNAETRALTWKSEFNIIVVSGKQ